MEGGLWRRHGSAVYEEKLPEVRPSDSSLQSENSTSTLTWSMPVEVAEQWEATFF